MTPDRSCGAKYKPISCPSSFSPWAQGGRRVFKRVRGQFGLAVRRWAGKQKDLGSIPLRLSFLLQRFVVCGHCLVTLSLTINETLKWLSSLPILMQESFWW